MTVYGFKEKVSFFNTMYYNAIQIYKNFDFTVFFK